MTFIALLYRFRLYFQKFVQSKNMVGSRIQIINAEPGVECDH